MREFEVVITGAKGAILRSFLVVSFNRGAAFRRAAEAMTETLGARSFRVEEC